MFVLVGGLSDVRCRSAFQGARLAGLFSSRVCRTDLSIDFGSLERAAA